MDDRLRAAYGPWFDFFQELPSNSRFTLKGMTFQGPGRGSGFLVRLEPQTHTVEGTYSSTGGNFRFELWSTEGSVVPGSFKALMGPVERLTKCEVVFANRTTSPGPSPIRFEFTVQDTVSGDCHR